jgi:hypothetical protein
MDFRSPQSWLPTVIVHLMPPYTYYKYVVVWAAERIVTEVERSQTSTARTACMEMKVTDRLPRYIEETPGAQGKGNKIARTADCPMWAQDSPCKELPVVGIPKS